MDKYGPIAGSIGTEPFRKEYERDAAAAMVHDREAIVARPEQLERADLHDVDARQQPVYGLDALIGVHFRKEEDLQLPAFDAAPPEITEAVLERMETETANSHQRAH